MKFRRKVILVFWIVLLLDLLVVNLAFQLFLRPIFISDTQNYMKRYGPEIETVLQQEPEDVEELLTSINAGYGIQTYVVSQDYEILYTEYGKHTKIGNPVKDQYMKILQEFQQVDENPYLAARYDNDGNERRLYYVRKMKDGNYIVMRKAVRGMEQDISILTKYGLMIMLILAVCSVIFWCLLTKSFTKQMEHMSRVTRKMSVLDFGERVGYRGKDEIGVLAESIDTLSDRLQESIGEIQSELEARKSLIRTLSHELKTPITTIKGYAENTVIVTEGNEKVARYSAIIIEECERLNALASEMLELSSLDNSAEFYEQKELETDVLFRDIQLRLAKEFPNEQLVFSHTNMAIYGNSDLLERAILNYVENAVKYGEKQQPITISGYREGQRFIFAVTNFGVEIPQKEQEAIWNPFYKIDPSRKHGNGYGVGLSFVAQIAKIHGGSVGVKCQDGKTTFTLELPIREK